MSTTAIKVGSLVIRTLAKPIATRIKSQAGEHPRFRQLCIDIAQHLHRIDMRLRLGLLRDTSANIERAEKAEAQHRRTETLRKLKEGEAKYPGATSTVRSDIPVPPEPVKHASSTSAATAPPRIRPLSESKAIDAGANFISEFFLFSVAGSLILVEAIRSKRREATRRDAVQERIELLEARKRQDGQRLEAVDGTNAELRARVAALEETVWRLQGGKGEFVGAAPARARTWEPTPLWSPQTKMERSFWQKVRGARGSGAAKAEDGEPEADAEGKDVVLVKPAAGSA